MPAVGSGTGALFSTMPANGFPNAHNGKGIRIDAIGEFVRLKQVVGGDPIVFHDEPVLHPRPCSG